MGKFINDHPFITLMLVTTVCNSVVRIIRPDAVKTFTVTCDGKTNKDENTEEPVANAE